MYYSGRRMTSEEYFLTRLEGYKYILKEKPDLESLVVLAKRKREVRRGSAIASIIFGIPLILLFAGIFMIMYGIYTLNCIDKNADLKHECLYYDDKNKLVIFKSFERGIWYALPPQKVWNIYGSDGNDLFGLTLRFEYEGDIEEIVYLELGFAEEKEKKALIEKMAAIRQGTFVCY